MYCRLHILYRQKCRKLWYFYASPKDAVKYSTILIAKRCCKLR